MAKRRYSMNDGPKTPGAWRWDLIPDYVKDRVNLRPWDDTDEDRFVQRLYPGYVVVTTPNGWKEVWVSDPPRNRNGLSRAFRVHYPDDPNPCPPIDERIVAHMMKYDPERGLNKQQFMEQMYKALQLIEKDKKLKNRAMAESCGDKTMSLLGDDSKMGKILRPVRSVLVPSNLQPAGSAP